MRLSYEKNVFAKSPYEHYMSSFQPEAKKLPPQIIYFASNRDKEKDRDSE